MAIYITGDTHGDFSKFAGWRWPEAESLTKDDLVIITGDFGGVWYTKSYNEYLYAQQERDLDGLEALPFSIAFVDGNHENHRELAKYPVVNWNGGLAHEIRPHIHHLIRGEIFTIEGKKFWCMGGASSHDMRDGYIAYGEPNWEEKAYEWSKMGMEFRIKGLTWWPEEIPSDGELTHGKNRLKEHDYKVDYIITHSPPASIVARVGHGTYEQDKLTKYLEDVRSMTQYEKWFCGHVHVDWGFPDEKIEVMYDYIERIA